MADYADKRRRALHNTVNTMRSTVTPTKAKTVTTSPLSDTARHLLLVKCAAADQQPETTTVCISSVTAPRATDPSTIAPIALGSFIFQSSPAYCCLFSLLVVAT